MVVFPWLFLSAIVFAAAGRILLGCFPGNHATNNNLLVVTFGAFFSAPLFMVIVFWVAGAVFHVSFQPRDENTLAFVSWAIGGLLGATIIAWRMTRPRPPRKGISA